MNPGDNCGVCFYALTNAGVLYCAHSHPDWQRSGAPAPGLLINWPVVTASDWCGEGYNNLTNLPFEPAAAAPGAVVGDVVSTSDLQLTSNTFVNIPGFTATLAAGETYIFEARIFYTNAGGGASGGLKLQLTGSVIGNIVYDGWQVDGNAIEGQNLAYALGTAVAAANTKGTNGTAPLSGSIVVSAGGTLQLQAAQNTTYATASVVKAGSIFSVRAV